MRIFKAATLLVAFLVSTVTSSHLYEAHFHFKDIERKHIDAHNSWDAFQKKHTSNIERTLYQYLGDSLVDNSIYDAYLSGFHNHNMDTVIFKAQLLFQNKMTRKDIIDKVHVDSNDRLTIVKLKPLHITSKVVQNIQSTFRFPNVYNEDSYCYNGVITLNNTCVCPDYFEGSTCFTPTCLNGGYPLEYTKCVCPPGFAGEHCQALPCGASSSIGDFDFSKKSFIVIVNTRESMTVDTEYAFPAIASSVGDFVLNNPDYYTNFILIAYLKNKNMNYMATFERNDFHEFIEDLQDVIISNGDEQQPTLSAIIKGLTSIRILRPKSPVYLFTDATISDSLATLDPNYYYDSQSQILRLLLGWNLNLQIATTTSPIHPSFTTKTLDYQVLQGLAQASGGDIFNFGANKNLIGQFVASYMTVLVNVEAAEYSYNFNVDPQGSPYPLSYYDSNADASFVLIVSGEVEIQEMVPTTSIGNILSIYIIPKGNPNTITFAKGTGIDYHFYSKILLGMYIGFARSQAADIDSLFPLNGIPAYPVVKSGLGDVKNLAFLTNIVDFGTQFYTSNKPQTRDLSCLFDKKMDTLKKCTKGVFIISSTFVVGKNQHTRIYPSYCQDTFYPKAPTCRNGGTMIKDICHCPNIFTGEYCEIPVCINGGFLNPFYQYDKSVCTCPAGYVGMNCELITCTNSDTEKFDTTKRTLSIVMSATSSQAYIKMQLYNGTNAFINNNVDIMSTMYDQFVMTRYGIVTKLTGETENVLDQIIYDDYQTFMYQMELLNFEYTTSTTQNTLSGIYDALSGKIAYNKKQTLIVFVDYAASELATNPDLLDQIKLQAIQNQVPINIFITPQFSGNSRQCIATQDMVPFQTLAKVTGGFFINQCQTYHDQTIANFMQQFLNVGASLESVAISDNSDCSAFTDITATFSQDLGNKYVLINYAAEVVPSKLIVTLDGVPRAFSSISTIPFIAIYDVSALLANKAYTIKFSQAETVYCRLIAGEDSTINHFLRFSDSPDSDYNSFNPIRGTFQHPVLHVSGSKSPFASAMLSVDDPGTGNQVNLQTTLNRISPCNFKGYFADSYSCTTAEDVPIFFNSVVSHADGSITRRALPTYCNTLQDYNCLNGGTFLNGKCMCDTNFSGNNCEIITCMNNGNADEGSCACSSSFGGQFCEYAICKAFNTNYMINNDANLEYQSIAYFIETSADAKDMNVLLAAHADSLDSFSHQLRNKFSLITFDDLSVTMQLDTVNSKVFYSEMQGVISTTTSAKTGVYTKSFEALNTFLSKNIEVPTLAYVFTTSEVADYSTHYADIIQHAQSKNVQINFIFYSDDSLIWNKASKPMMAMNSIALTTSGRFLVLNGKTLPTFIGDYMDDTIFENAILYNEYDDQSLTQLSRSSNIPLQNSTFGVTIIVKGEDVNKDFGVFDQDGNKIEHLNNTVIWSKDLIVIYLPFYEGNYGALTVKATTSSIPYHIQVRTYDSYNIRVGFVQNYNDDMAAPFPMLNQGNKYFVALHDQHSEYRRSLGSIDAVKIYAVTPQKSFSSQAVEYKFIQRNTIGCAFEYVSNKITFPTDPSELMAVKIVGQDQYQNRFQRLYFYFPITPTCANNNMYDSVKGKCLCDTNHQGSVCSYPICHNGGTSDFGICNCQVGFYGDYCESYLN